MGPTPGNEYGKPLPLFFRGRRLGWLEWLVTKRDGKPARVTCHSALTEFDVV